MEHIQFIDLTSINALMLFLLGLTGGVVSGFIGSSGAFILTPALMALGMPGVVAVASNMAHRFPKSLEAAYKRHKYGQVDFKLGLVIGIFAGIGVLLGKEIMVGIYKVYGAVGTDLYVSSMLVMVLIVAASLVLRDGMMEKHGQGRFNVDEEARQGMLARFVRSINVPGTMLEFKGLDTKVSLLVLAPLGLVVGILGASIAVGGFIGLPAMIYVLGMPALTASATELVIASIIGFSGSLLYALDGMVDIRVSMIVMAGTLFGIRIGSIGATYAKDYVIKLVIATVMLFTIISQLFYLPGYLSDIGLIAKLNPITHTNLDDLGEVILVVTLLAIALVVMQILYKASVAKGAGIDAPASISAVPLSDIGSQLSPLGRFQRFLVASDGSEFSAAAVREAIGMASKCGAELHLMSLVTAGLEYESIGENVLKRELEKSQAHLDEVKTQAQAAGVTNCQTHLIHGQTIHQEILALADRLQVDVIVMGRRGRRGLARMMVGHATAMVIGKARCSVLVVPRFAKIQGRHILVATDGSRFGDAAAITATKLGSVCKTKVTVVSVTNTRQSEERRTEAWYAVNRAAEHMYDMGIDVNTRTLEGNPAKVITDLARECNSDLIITGSHGRTGLDRVLIGSTSERILSDTPCAVLVVKAT